MSVRRRPAIKEGAVSRAADNDFRAFRRFKGAQVDIGIPGSPLQNAIGSHCIRKEGGISREILKNSHCGFAVEKRIVGG
jgi:hypothetical protein